MQNNSHSNFRSQSHANPGGPTASVNQIVESIIEVCAVQFEQNSIVVELDLEKVDAEINDQLVRKTTRLLLDNATEKMLDKGGTISVTLIDAEHQWELEVADSKGMAYQNFGQSSNHQAEKDNEAQNTNPDLPVIIQFPSTDALRQAYRTAAELGGQIQTWDCPQGGTAHVLVVPKNPHRKKRSV